MNQTETLDYAAIYAAKVKYFKDKELIIKLRIEDEAAQAALRTEAYLQRQKQRRCNCGEYCSPGNCYNVPA